MDHSQVGLHNLLERKVELLEYMKKDILLLGGIMLTAQHIYWDQFHIDIVKKITSASLALTIFRKNYYDPIVNPIYIPNANVDNFIRSGYYGGHTDVYKPKGENLYYYDVNSLYPYVMKNYPMPSLNGIMNYKRKIYMIYSDFSMLLLYVLIH
jgi:hypothetical protein